MLTPVTVPVPEPTLTVPSALLHKPPGVALCSVIVPLTQTEDGPVIAAGKPATVTTVVALQLPSV